MTLAYSTIIVDGLWIIRVNTLDPRPSPMCNCAVNRIVLRAKIRQQPLWINYL